MSLSALASPAASSADRALGLLVEELTAKLQAGLPVDVQTHAEEHPEHAERLHHLLPALRLLADLGRSAAGTSGGLAPVKGPQDQVGTLGDFRILREVGRGGMGIVYEAEQISLGRRVALKVLPFAATMDPRHLQRFHNEARAAAGLHHTNIVPVYGVGCERGVHYYAMQFIEGRTLADFIAQQRTGSPLRVPTVPEVEADASAPTVPPAAQATSAAPRDAAYFRRVAEWGIQAAEALDCAHALGIVHRDVKPANLMVDVGGRLWVTDFGLAQVQSDARLTRSGDLLGTLRYMSPEQALAKHVVLDHRTDVYSLGATLYELLTLEPVFTGTDRQELLRQIAFEEPKRPRRLHRTIPAELETIVLKALERNPADRYATAQEVANDLRNVVEDRPIRAKRPSLLHRLGRWRRRHKPLVWSVAVLMFVVLLLGGSVLGWQQRQWAALEQAVGDDLREADLLQKEERWSEELRVLERASGRLAAGGSPQLRERVEQRRNEVALVARLEEARLQRSAVGPDGRLDNAGADQAYAAAFASYGLNLETLAPEEAAERIRTSPIRTQLVVALDDWASCKKDGHVGSEERLRIVARLADDDPWRQQLRDPEVRKDRAALERLAEAEGVLAQPPVNLIRLSKAIDAVKGRVVEERLLRRAQERYPADFWINFELASCLYEEPATRAEAIGFLRVALALRPHSHAVHNNLGVALQEQKKLAEAEAALRKAIELMPNAETYINLGNALLDQKKLAEAEAAYHKAIELKPDFASAYYSLGIVLRQQGKLAEAVAAYRKAIELKPDYAEAHCNLGIVLRQQGKLAEAVAAYRKAIELKPDFPEAHYGLGIVLQGQGQLVEAVAVYRKVIELKPDFPEAHCNLGQVLALQGQFAEALAHRRRGHELGSQRPGWPYPSALRVKESERLVELDAKLPKVLMGEVEPADVGERLALAQLCQLPCKSLYAAAVRFYAGAFAAQPGPADDLRAGHRYNAARAAALAGCGQGKDADHLNAQEGARLRKQALDWLRDDLTAWRNLLEKDKDKAAPVVLQRMQHWQGDTDFNGVRGAEALAKLPEAERGDWQRLWEEVAALRQRAQPKAK